jgi:hypothetical protein
MDDSLGWMVPWDGWFSGENCERLCIMSVTYLRIAHNVTLENVQITWQSMGEHEYRFLNPFQSFEFRRYTEHIGIMHWGIAPRWPRANPQAESFNRPLMKAVQSANMHQLNWKQEMFKFLRQHRCTQHVSTDQTSHRLLFSRERKTMLSMVPLGVVDLHFDEKTRIKDSDAKYKMKRFADTWNRAEHRDTKVGDSVLLKRD